MELVENLLAGIGLITVVVGILGVCIFWESK